MTVPDAYSVTTWDIDLQAFTEDDDIPDLVYGIAGLRNALRKLRNRGYDTHRSIAHSILVENVSEAERELAAYRSRKEGAA